MDPEDPYVPPEDTYYPPIYEPTADEPECRTDADCIDDDGGCTGDCCPSYT